MPNGVVNDVSVVPAVRVSDSYNITCQLLHLALGTMIAVAYLESLFAGDVNVEQMDFAVLGH